MESLAGLASVSPLSLRSIFEGGKLRLVPGMPAHEVEQVLVRLDRASDVSNYALAFYLHDLDATHSCQELGFPNAVTFARVRLRMEKSRAYELIRAGRELRELPKINAAAASGELAWSRARLIIGIATPETEDEWLELAKVAGFDELRLKVRGAKRGGRPPGKGKGTPNVRLKVQFHLDVLEHLSLQTVRAKLEAERGERLGFGQVVVHLVQLGLSMQPDGSIPGWEPIAGSPFRLHAQFGQNGEGVELMTSEGSVPLEPEAARRFKNHAEVIDPAAMRVPEPARPVAGELAPKTPAALRDFVIARDRFRCVNCGATVALHAHHIIWRSTGGPTSAENLATACVECHAMIHEGKLKMTGKAPDGLVLTDDRGRAMSGPLRAEPPVEVAIEPLAEAADPQPTVRLSASAETAPAGAAAAAPASPIPPLHSTIAERGTSAFVTFDMLPSSVDARWWREHAHLFDWNARRSVFEFQPGRAVAVMPRDPETAVPDRNPSFRPRTLDDIRGQERVVRVLKRSALAARIQGRAARHVLLEGAPGLGKTALAEAFAAGLGTVCRPCCASTLKDPGVLFGNLAALSSRDVLFIDEIHALPREIAEFLYTGMEDFHLDVQVSEGSRATTLRVKLEPFTLIAATTSPELIPRPLRDRFQLPESVDFYEAEELAVIAAQAAAQMQMPISHAAATRIGKAGRGTPRRALSLVQRVVDAAVVEDKGTIDESFAARVLDEDGVDENGLDAMDRKIMQTLLQSGRREPMGIKKLAAMVGISAATIQSVHEPFLMRMGLMTATQRGRIATQRAAFLPQLRNETG